MQTTTVTSCPVCQDADLTLHCDVFAPEPETNSGASLDVIDCEADCGCGVGPTFPGIEEIAWEALADEDVPEADPYRA